MNYATTGNIVVTRDMVNMQYTDGVSKILTALDNQLGVLLVSNFEYPGRYARFDIGFINPPLQITASGNKFKIQALNKRGNILLGMIMPHLTKLDMVRYIVIPKQSNSTDN